jgi:hypothetical protein
VGAQDLGLAAPGVDGGELDGIKHHNHGNSQAVFKKVALGNPLNI